MIKPGLHLITMDKYLADPCQHPSLSSSCAHKLLARSPLHAWYEHPKLGRKGGDNEDDDNLASDTGTIAHDMLLGGEGTICVIDPEDHRSAPTKINPDGSVPKGWTNASIRQARDDARTLGLTPILKDKYADVSNMVHAAKTFLATTELAGVLDRGRPEMTMIWEEEGTWFRARPDWLTDNGDVMLHYKTTLASARPEPFIRGLMPSMGYDVALSFYRRGHEALGGSPDTQHLIFVQEQAAPYACSLIGLSPVMMAIADEKVNRAVKLWRECMRTKTWPAYSPEIHYADPTAWQLAEAEAALQNF